MYLYKYLIIYNIFSWLKPIIMNKKKGKKKTIKKLILKVILGTIKYDIKNIIKPHKIFKITVV